jgi:hypothetical protein
MHRAVEPGSSRQRDQQFVDRARSHWLTTVDERLCLVAACERSLNSRRAGLCKAHTTNCASDETVTRILSDLGIQAAASPPGEPEKPGH